MEPFSKHLRVPGARWVNRETELLLASIGRYTRFVLFSKMFLVSLSVVAILTIIVIPVISADKEGLRIAFSNVQEKMASLPVMSNPRFQGVDENNQPYTVTADSALQHDDNTIVLNALQADMFTEDNAWLSLSSKKGTLNTQTKQLLLTDDVQLFHDAGYTFNTNEAHVDMAQQQAYGEQRIDGQGPMGTIVADGFEIVERGKVMRFRGNVKLTLYPQ